VFIPWRVLAAPRAYLAATHEHYVQLTGALFRRAYQARRRRERDDALPCRLMPDLP
jgi:hypothetical protein